MSHWEIYPTQLNSELLLILVDLEWHERSDTVDFGVLNWFRVGFEPGPQGGMPGEADREFLEKFGEWLADEYEGRGHMVARLTAPGRREFFVYSQDSLAETVGDRARSVFAGTRLESRSRPDPEWTVYREFLYPDPVQTVRIRALHRTRAMQEDGDLLTAARPVDHVAAFHSAEQRKAFRTFALDEGFDVVDERDSEDESLTRPFLIRVQKLHALDPVGIEHNVVRLFAKIREQGGEYGGWVAEVMRLS